MNDERFDFTQAYKVDGHAGIAWRADKYVTEMVETMEYDEGDDEYLAFVDYEEVENRERVECHMIGDDATFEFDVSDLTPLEDEEYCSGCGQIGCGWC